jgi:hypothetical protein
LNRISPIRPETSRSRVASAALALVRNNWRLAEPLVSVKKREALRYWSISRAVIEPIVDQQATVADPSKQVMSIRSRSIAAIDAGTHGNH